MQEKTIRQAARKTNSEKNERIKGNGLEKLENEKKKKGIIFYGTIMGMIAGFFSFWIAYLFTMNIPAELLTRIGVKLGIRKDVSVGNTYTVRQLKELFPNKLSKLDMNLQQKELEHKLNFNHIGLLEAFIKPQLYHLEVVPIKWLEDTS